MKLAISSFRNEEKAIAAKRKFKEFILLSIFSYTATEVLRLEVNL